MPTFELRPVEAKMDHPDWELSDHRAPCRVVAADENAARVLAARAFAIDKARSWGATAPWTNRDLVEAVLVISGAFPSFSEGTILMPTSEWPGFKAARRRQ